MLDGNIYRKAQRLLRDKPIQIMNVEELITVKAALIHLDIWPELNGRKIDEGLEKLAQLFDKAK